MAAGTGDFAEELWPGILKHYQLEYTDFEPIYTKIWKVQPSTKAFEKIQGLVGLPLAGIKTQGQSTPFIDPMQGHQKEIVNVSYSIGTGITKEMYDDDQYGLINDAPKFLARSMKETLETTHHAPWNASFTTALSADGDTIFSTSHTMMDSVYGDLSNMGQSGVSYVLSQTSLENATILMSAWIDDRGKRINLKPVTLFVPTALRFTAQKILETEYEVGTANNTVNPVRGMFNLIWSPYLSSSTAWFLLADYNAQGKSFVSLDRMTPDLERDNEFTTRNMNFSTMGRWGMGVADWRGAWGSTGT